MAYRLPTERRDRSNDSTTISYLEHFLEQVDPLSAQAKSAFTEIRQLDDKLNTIISNAQATAEEVIHKSITKGTPIETARRTYHEFIHLQTSAKELSDKKIAIATSMHSSTDSVLSELDRRLLEFETQLKRDGRWPGANPQPSIQPNTPDKPKANRSPSAKAPRPEISNNATSHPLSTRAAQKNRHRDSSHSITQPSPRARTATAANRATSTATSTQSNETVKQEPKGSPVHRQVFDQPVSVRGTPSLGMKAASVKGEIDENLGEENGNERSKRSLKELSTDIPPEVVPVREGSDGNAVDETLYCSCQRVSHGDMIACEGKNCPYEWYHFECVGLKEAPEGMWFCPTCRDKRRKSGHARRKLG